MKLQSFARGFAESRVTVPTSSWGPIFVRVLKIRTWDDANPFNCSYLNYRIDNRQLFIPS